MTDNEIIKRLERCVKCGNRNYDTDIVLDLIYRQQAEIERLKECPKCIYEYDGNTTEYCIEGPCSNFKTTEQLRTEAYKEFAERLNAEAQMADCFNSYSMVVETRFINNLLKEMEDKSR